ncbi:MAG: site-specific integrase [Betaproteobacteria bacterium]|nr:site-specific integrase [Betaproteobacteria bacterium]
MAQIECRGPYQYRVRIRRKGYPTICRTFDTKTAAEKWARATEHEIDVSGFIDRRGADKTTLRALLEQYRKEVTPTKRSAEMESVKIMMILRDPVLPNLKMSALTSMHLSAWRDRRLSVVSGATVNREIDVLSAAINHARREWGIHIENPVELIKRPVKANARDRRLTPEEERYLTEALTPVERRTDGTFEKAPRNPWLAPLFHLATATAMRRGELLALQWQHVDLKRRTAHLPITKNGDARTVPLSTAALKILKSLPAEDRTSGSVFPTTAMALRKGFTRAVERAQAKYIEDCKTTRTKPNPMFLADVHFHDTRHEAATRMAEKLSNVLELSAVTGHRDLKSLKRYYHPRAEDLAKKLD